MRPVEIVTTIENPKQHKWLKWVGLQEPPVEADSWVPVVRGLRPADDGSGSSRLGARLVKLLADGTHYASSEMLPLIPGVDGVGRLEDGTRVYFGMSRIPFGTFATLV